MTLPITSANGSPPRTFDYPPALVHVQFWDRTLSPARSSQNRQFRDGFQFCSDLVAPRCSLDVLKRRAVPKTFLKRGKVSIGCSQGNLKRHTDTGRPGPGRTAPSRKSGSVILPGEGA